MVFRMRPNHFVQAAVLFFWLGNAAHGQTAAAGPRQILQEMVATYKSLSSYQDTGFVRTLTGDSTLMAGSDGFHIRGVSLRDDTLVSFKTHYARPGKFRFEWRSPSTGASRDSAIWSDGKQAYVWSPLGSGEGEGFIWKKGSALRWCVDEAQRSSVGAAYFVPSLLMKDVSLSPFADLLSIMDGLMLAREERVDGESCHVIKGEISGVPWALWVGKETRLLRKTRTLYTSASFHETLEKRGRVKTSIAEEVHRDIVVNKRIPEEVFRYRPRLRSYDLDITR